MSTKMHTRAFTLVELLVVISIIGLLTAILVPVLGKAKEAGRRAACASNLRQIGVALRMYLNENGDHLPDCTPFGGWPEPPDEEIPYKPDIATTLKPYVSRDVSDEQEVFHCPADIPGKTKRPYELQDMSYFESDGTSYAYNFHLSGEKMYEVVRNQWVKQYFGGQVTEEQIWIMRDYVAFHGEAGEPGAANYLYIDGHVGDLAK